MPEARHLMSTNFSRADVGRETRLGDHESANPRSPPRPVGHDGRAAAVRDVRERTAVHEGGRALGVCTRSAQRVAQDRRHRAGGLQLRRTVTGFIARV